MMSMMMGMMQSDSPHIPPMNALPPLMPGASHNLPAQAQGRGPPTIHPMLMATNPMLVMQLMAQHGPGIGDAPSVGDVRAQEEAAPEAEEDDTGMDPDVQELCDHFHIEERHCKTLHDIMKKRRDSFSEDLEKLYNKLEQANSPNGLLVVKMREMVDGTFVGMIRPCANLLALSKKFKLDAPAETKLADILGRYDPERKADYIKELEKHLEVAGRPSAIVMMMLKKISDGMPLGKVGAPQAGSWAARQNQDNRGKSRSRDRGRKKSRSRSRRRR